MTQQLDTLEEQTPKPEPEPETPETPDTVDAPPTTEQPPAKTRSGAGRVRGAIRAVWRAKGLWLGLIALGCALFGQKLVVERFLGQPMSWSIRWYAIGILLMLIAWSGTYKNKSMLRLPDPDPDPDASSVSEADDGRWTTDDGSRVAHPSQAQETDDGKEHRPPSVVRRLSSLRGRIPAWVFTLGRYLLAFVALGLNLYFANMLRSNYYSPVGGWGWVASLLLLLVAFIGYRPKVGADADAGIHDIEDKTDWRFSRKVEIAIFLAIFALAAFMRLYRLGDWTSGMHGDEGEAGYDALRIVQGNLVSPFEVGWFAQPNFYYWGIAIGMKLFGTDLGGLRAFAAFCGLLMFLPFYPMVRSWFGVRVALIATFFLAISDITLHVGRAQFSNVTTPLLLVAGFYFLFRGLRDMRVLNFVLAGFSFSSGLYFYNGGRLSPLILAGAIAYLFLLMPLVRLPGVYTAIRKQSPGVKRTKALGRAAWKQVRGVTQYAGQILMLAIATVCFATPWYYYLQDHQGTMGARVNEKAIFYNAQRMVEQHGVIPGQPLFIGLRMPTMDDTYPVLPVVFEQTPLSIKLADDGFWHRTLWNQLTTTLSILTLRPESSGVYTFTQEPIAKPIEAVLIALGVAWALWRWKDTRMSMLSIWFWATMIAGGVLTIDAPYVARLVGMLPVLAIFAALVVNKLIAELVGVGDWGLEKATNHRSPIPNPQSLPRRVGLAVSGAVLVVLLSYLTWQNFYDYYVRYLGAYPFGPGTGYAVAVRQLSDEIVAEGRPTPKFYSMGAPDISWFYGVNAFLNHSIQGVDMTNLSDHLPLLDKGKQDIVFILWQDHGRYLPVLQNYYPNGEAVPFHYGFRPEGRPPYMLTSYRVRLEELQAMRYASASYTSKSPGARPMVRREDGLGTTNPPPGGLAYPAQAMWTSKLVVPQFANYRFQLTGIRDGTLEIDGSTVLSVTAQTEDPTAGVILAKGVHDVRLAATLTQPSDAAKLEWSVGNAPFIPVHKEYLWAGIGSGLAGEVRLYTEGTDINQDPPPDEPNSGNPPVIQRRLDSFLGFRDVHNSLSGGLPFIAEWNGVLNILQSGEYDFEVFATGMALLMIDGQQVLSYTGINPAGVTTASKVYLDAGTHDLKLRYNWSGGDGYFEAYWTPPGGEKTFLASDVLSVPPGTGAWQPGTVTEPPYYQLPSEDEEKTPAQEIRPDKVIDLEGALARPRGLAVDSQGNLYVADWGNNRIVVFSSDGKMLRTWGKAPPTDTDPPKSGEFVSLTDVALGDDDTIYALDGKGSLLQVMDHTGAIKRIIDISLLGMYSPNGLTVGQDGSLYVADTGQSRVLKLPPDFDPAKGGEPPQIFDGMVGKDGGPTPNSKLKETVDVAVGEFGGEEAVYAVDLQSRIVRFSQDGRMIGQWGVKTGGNDGGSKLAFAPDGKTLYMTNPDTRQIVVLNTESGQVRLLQGVGEGSGTLAQPSGIAVGPDGRLYVVDNAQSNIKVYTLNK